jgi:hypothetical protein
VLFARALTSPVLDANQGLNRNVVLEQRWMTITMTDDELWWRLQTTTGKTRRLDSLVRCCIHILVVGSFKGLGKQTDLRIQHATVSRNKLCTTCWLYLEYLNVCLILELRSK